MRSNLLRITSGEFKGREITLATHNTIRPTSERVREALMSIVTSRRNLKECAVLDLYAGSGAIGFEAFSRGAKYCLFVESNKTNCAAIKKNASKFGIDTKCGVLCSPVENVTFEKIVKTAPNINFSIVFSDAPYDLQSEETVINLFTALPNVPSKALLIVETSSRAKEIEVKTNLQSAIEIINSRVYGDTKITLLEKK